MIKKLFLILLVISYLQISSSAILAETLILDGDKIKDTSVLSKLPDRNFSSSPQLKIGDREHGPIGRIYIWSDFSVIPIGSVIENANLRLFYYYSSSAQMYQSKGALVKVLENWDASELKWSNQPLIGTTAISTCDVDPWMFSPSYGWRDLDITSDVQAIVNGSSPNFGFAIKLITTNDWYPDFPWGLEVGDEDFRISQERCFYSSEAQINQPYSPSISITYQKPTQTIANLVEKKHDLFKEGMIDNSGIVISLDAKLNQAQKFVIKNQKDQAQRILFTFIKEVSAQSGKHITNEAANILIDNSHLVIESIKND